MTYRTPPPAGGNWKIWAEQIRAYLASSAAKLVWKTQKSTPFENGVIHWDEENGYPVVSKNGKWQPFILEDSPLDFAVKVAELEILNKFGDTVSVLDRSETLLKFGRTDGLGTTQETVWVQGGTEVLPTTNVIDTISSSNAGDAQVVTIEGHTVTGTGASSQFTFVSQSATLNGQNKVVLTTPLARVQRLIDTDATPFAGDVYVYEDTTITGGVPTTSPPIHMKVLAGEAQSYKASFTVANGEYFLFTGGFASVNKKTSASVDVEFQVATPGGPFRPVSRITFGRAGTSTAQIDLNPYPIVPKNCDARVVAVSSATNTEVSASFQGYYADIVT